MKRLLANLKEADIRNILAVIKTVGVFGIMYLLIIKAIPEQNHDIVISAVSFVFGALSNVDGYFFSASKNNKQKDENTNQNT